MRHYTKWMGKCLEKGDWFPARVPGNIQMDYAAAHDYGDISYGLNFKEYEWMEPHAWLYKTTLDFTPDGGKRLFFVSEGIDYKFDILLGDEIIHSQEGMFTKVLIDLTGKARPGDELFVRIYPHPKREDAEKGTRAEADRSVKPAVSYGWDWHPRVIPSGIWNDTYFEERGAGYIDNCEPFYKIDKDYKTAEISFDILAGAPYEIEFFSAEGELLYKGSESRFTLSDIRLWWCNGQGEPYLYRWRVYTGDDEKTGFLGLRTVELVMNEGAWHVSNPFPSTRSAPPFQLLLNGRRVFAKGTNWVNPEIFIGAITEDTYLPLLELARDANMNILRTWGGAIVNKEAFFDLCDKMGLMVWQEFPLSCNKYIGEAHYLSVLEAEASSVIVRLRRHACLILWCGGNELFCYHSGMDDQALPLRLLNKLCYELDRDTPFIPTSPIMGVGHGGYVFYSEEEKIDAFLTYRKASCTAYTEFGMPGTPSAEYLKSFIPADELFPPQRGGVWEAHHAFNALGEERWLCLDVLDKYFGEIKSLDELVYYSEWLQCEGYKAIFEEARRQRPFCSMALNWCYNEPWKTAANNSIVSYPAVPKKAYFAVRDALRPVLASARIEKFSWRAGETFGAELWLLNDSPKAETASIRASVKIGESEIFLGEWTGEAGANENARGPVFEMVLPKAKGEELILTLAAENGWESRYRLQYSL